MVHHHIREATPAARNSQPKAMRVIGAVIAAAFTGIMLGLALLLTAPEIAAVIHSMLFTWR